MKCLVIFLGQIRASNIVAESFDKYVRSSINPGGEVDLALCRCEGYSEPDSYFANTAKYVWECPQPLSWNGVFKEVARSIGVADPSAWESLLDIPGNWMGEITEAAGVRPGSAVRCIFLRYLALSMIERLGLLQEYSWFILTRSDYLYLAPHPPLDLLSNASAWAPRAEAYWGITDRHIVFKTSEARRVLDVLTPLLKDPQLFRRRLSRACSWNLERYLKVAYLANGLFSALRFYPTTAFLVRNADTDTSWSRGTFSRDLGYFVKYPSEREAAIKTADRLREVGSWSERFLVPSLCERVERLVFGAAPPLYGYFFRAVSVAGRVREQLRGRLHATRGR